MQEDRGSTRAIWSAGLARAKQAAKAICAGCGVPVLCAWWIFWYSDGNFELRLLGREQVLNILPVLVGHIFAIDGLQLVSNTIGRKNDGHRPTSVRTSIVPKNVSVEFNEASGVVVYACICGWLEQHTGRCNICVD